MTVNTLILRFIPDTRDHDPEDRPQFHGNMLEQDTDQRLWLDGYLIAQLQKDGLSAHWELQDDYHVPKHWYPHFVVVSPALEPVQRDIDPYAPRVRPGLKTREHQPEA